MHLCNDFSVYGKRKTPELQLHKINNSQIAENCNCTQNESQKHWGKRNFINFVRADFREGDADSNFSIFRVRRFTESPRPLH